MEQSGFDHPDLEFANMARDELEKVTVAAKLPRHRSSSSMETGLPMLVDGGSTCVIIQDERLCTNVRPASIRIKVGSDHGKPSIVNCAKVGNFTFKTLADGVAHTHTAVARIVPNFGCDILPEYIFLQQKFEVNKKWKHLQIKNTNGVRVAVGEAFKHDNTWLFYVEVFPELQDQPSESTKLTTENFAPSNTFINTPASYCVMDLGYDAEQEELSMLPIYNATEALRNELVLHTGEMSPDEYLKEHEKLGHRNSRDVATIVGRPLPKKLPVCTICLQATQSATLWARGIGQFTRHQDQDMHGRGTTVDPSSAEPGEATTY